MGMSQFTKFCKDCRLVDKKNLKVSDLDRIYLRANQDRLGDMHAVMDQNLTKKQAAKAKATKNDPRSDELDVHEFGAATIRVATQRYPQLPAIADRYRKLMEENIKSNQSKCTYLSDLLRTNLGSILTSALCRRFLPDSSGLVLAVGESRPRRTLRPRRDSPLTPPRALHSLRH